MLKQLSLLLLLAQTTPIATFGDYNNRGRPYDPDYVAPIAATSTEGYYTYSRTNNINNENSGRHRSDPYNSNYPPNRDDRPVEGYDANYPLYGGAIASNLPPNRDQDVGRPLQHYPSINSNYPRGYPPQGGYPNYPSYPSSNGDSAPVPNDPNYHESNNRYPNGSPPNNSANYPYNPNYLPSHHVPYNTSREYPPQLPTTMTTSTTTTTTTTTEGYFNYSNSNSLSTEHPGGRIIKDKVIFYKNKSPYWLRDDLIIEKDAEVIIEPGVEIRFEPQVGITVRGILTAVGTELERIHLTSSEEASAKPIKFPDIRLVDGPSILAGRVQINYNGKWRSVCTNSKNWTMADMEIACRQLGFQGGTFFNWYNRQMPLRPRLLYEEPRCIGSEASIFKCQWGQKQMGSGVCDYHPDLGIECLPRHERAESYWRGIRFEQAKNDKRLTLSNTLYVPTSLSKLQYVNVKLAGSGRGRNATSAIHIEGVPPKIHHVDIFESAYNGINVTAPEAPMRFSNLKIRGSRGYGIFFNSSFGSVHVDGSYITENGADGIKYVHHEERADEQFDKTDVSDFCTLATVSSQTFPLQVFAEQRIFSTVQRRCSKVFSTKYGHKITLYFLRAVTDRNNSADIEVYDGSSTNNRLITEFKIRNNTRPQSVTTLSNQIYVKFRADASTNMYIYMRLTSGLEKAYDLNVSYTDISENGGNGVTFDNLRSQLHIHNSSISKNSHVAGVHVTSGVGDVNVTASRISFNEGDGINVTYTGGSRNISRTSISSNTRYGFALWLNQTKETEYLFVNQTSVVEYSEILKNLDIGILHGNFCGHSFINITGNSFMDSLNDALEILSCWIPVNTSTKLQIGHNSFLRNQGISVKIYPALNIDGTIEFNSFTSGTFGQLLIKNKPLEEFNSLKTNLLVQSNYFRKNMGIFVANMGLSPYSETQHLLFTKNFVQQNVITEPFQTEDGSISKLNPRSRVAAPIVIASSNVKIFRNIIENPGSSYEIGSHLEDQSKLINCTFNWMGSSQESEIFYRIFHRYNRYNLAKIIFVPYLLHNSHPGTTRINYQPLFVPHFQESKKVGGEIEGEETLTQGEYLVDKDINIRPGGKLTLEPGVTLRFPPCIGMMVGGKLEARGLGPDSIRFTLKEEIIYPTENLTYDTETEKYEMDTEMVEIETKTPIRLLGGPAPSEGRLQIKINNEWGTVCNYGWTIKNAALVCQQLGMALNPDDWNLERNEIPNAGTAEKIILSNVDCEDYDLDITTCKSERVTDFESSCTHDNDVGIRCYETSWAGVRFGVLAERSDLQYITIEKSGLLDYATSTFKPALQMDFARQNFENIKISDNFHDGFGIMYSDIYTVDDVNNIKNSEFINNKGAGVSFKQLGLQIVGSRIENNFAGIQHNPALSGLQQRELAGWFASQEVDINYRPFWIPHELDINNIKIEHGQTKHIVTSPVIGDTISRSYKIRCEPDFVIGIQLLNPIENRSTEAIVIYDSQNYNNNSAVWHVKRDLSIFPTTSSSHGIILDYNSGSYAIGNTVIIISAIRAPTQTIYNRIVKGPVPTLTVRNTKIKNNQYGIHVSYYNRYFNEQGDHFLRKSNESIKLLHCDISHNKQEAVFVHSPHWDLYKSNISEITIMINGSLITDNGKGIYHFSRDMRASNNLFHYIFQDDTFERNWGGGLQVNLPYVWQYNENFTHSVYINNNTWRANKDFRIVIDGHFAIVNITNSVFSDNICKTGLLSIKGMEKKLKITNNRIIGNNGKFMVEFSSDSQCEIMGEVPAKFKYNELKNNKFAAMMRGFGTLQLYSDPTTVLGFKGIQKVMINRNLFSGNSLDYDLVAGIKTAKLDNYLDVRENWWGTNEVSLIENRIFDFDDWNNHAIANFRPYLTEDNLQASQSPAFVPDKEIDLDYLKGRINKDLEIYRREKPYFINADLTVMPQVTLTIQPGVTMEFAPNVGILVLGNLQARGSPYSPIIMKSQTKRSNMQADRQKRQVEAFGGQDSIRLCKGRDCLENDKESPNEGFLEYFNRTTLQWIPMCDPRFTERNAQVVCRELGFDSLSAFFSHDIRIEFHSNSLSRIWSWPEPLQCKGIEGKYEECPIRLNGQQFGHRHECKWDTKFVFIHCGLQTNKNDYWGGIRFADAEFEQHLYEHRIHDHHTHQTLQAQESRVEFVQISGAGILHNEKSPAVQGIKKSPNIQYVNISDSASHGINLISPSNTVNLISNIVRNSLGVGINFLSITGEGRESEESSFSPLKDLNIPYNLHSMIDICDTTKEMSVEERVLVYYKYDNHPVNCIKIFKSKYNVKPFGFRLLQFNLFNATNKYGIPDFISLYDGDIYNISSKLIGMITTESKDERRMFRTKESSLSIKLFANGASSNHGFIAEIVTLPISAIGFNRDVQHNITNTVVQNNREGGILYVSAGEVNPIVTIERSQFSDNCEKLYGNFTTCRAAVDLDVQNTQTLYFRNNLINRNQGGLAIKADSRGSATSLKGYIYNNLFFNNTNLPALYIEGRHSSPYQEVIIYRNYFTQNVAKYENNIVLRQVVSNFTLNYVKRNVGLQNLEVSGFDKVRLPIYQSTSHNSFYHNYAVHVDTRSTIVAGTAGQHYVDNIFFNPDNDYEIITVNKSLFNFNSTLEVWKTKIDAALNYWGLNTTLAVTSRIRDYTDDQRLLEVIYAPYHMNNETLLGGGKCPPGWDLVVDTCYMYVGAPMTFYEARDFCQSDNSSMPYVNGYTHIYALNDFLRNQQEWFKYSDKVWVQEIDRINQCTAYAFQSIEIIDCNQRNPFICEIDPKIIIDSKIWRGDVLIIAVICAAVLGFILIGIVAACWWNKSKYRHSQRLERRNSIRASRQSLRSVGSTNGFSDIGYRRKPAQMSSRSTDKLTEASDYRKMVSNGSLDSMEKSTYNSSIEDNQSYDVYETQNPQATTFNTTQYHKPQFDPPYAEPTRSFNQLGFKNEGFKDNSTFASNSNYPSRSASIQETTLSGNSPVLVHTNDSFPPSDYYNTDTLPLNATSSTLSDIQRPGEGRYYGQQQQPSQYMSELKTRLPTRSKLPSPPTPPRVLEANYNTAYNTVALEPIRNGQWQQPTHTEPSSSGYVPVYRESGRPRSAADVLETDFDVDTNRPTEGDSFRKKASRSKSEALLETNFDFESDDVPLSIQMTEGSRSKSQPLETAM